MRGKFHHFIIMFIMMGLAGASLAEKRPPGTMIGTPQPGQDTTFEVPAHFVGVAGGVSDSFAARGSQGLEASFALGQSFIGRSSNASFTVESGYEVFEFYSDRIPIENLIIRIEGEPPGALATNTKTVRLNISFTDDLSGLRVAKIREPIPGGFEQELGFTRENIIDYTIRRFVGDDDPPDGRYPLLFSFEDNAGNLTPTDIEVMLVLDRTPPTDGSVLINRGNLFTTDPNVDVTLADSFDIGAGTSGVNAIRLSTDQFPPRTWSNPIPLSIFPTTIRWRLDTSGPAGDKYIAAQYRDAAGNWNVNPVIDSITLGVFNPNGDFKFELVPNQVIQRVGFVETNLALVNIMTSWDNAPSATVSKVEIWGGWASTDPENRRFFPINGESIDGDRVTMTVPYQIVSDAQEIDVQKTIYARFYDFDDNPSATLTQQICFNQDRPAPPEVTYQIQDDNILFDVSLPDGGPNVQSIVFEASNFSIGNGASTAAIVWDLLNPGVTYLDSDLIPNTPYEYTITAKEEFTTSLPVTINRATLADSPQPGTFTAIETTVLDMSYSGQRNPPDTKYDIEWSINPFSDLQAPCIDCGQILATIEFKHRIENLILGTSYYFKARAKNRNEVYTQWVTLGVGSTLKYQTPQPPAEFYAAEITDKTILWKWVRNPSTEDEFVILDAFERPVATIPNIPLIQDYQYLEENLTPDTEYFRKIVSVNQFKDQTTTSNPKTSPVILTRPAPLTLVEMDMNGSQLTVVWDNNGNPKDTEMAIEIAQDEDFTLLRQDSGWLLEPITIFPDLEPGTNYYVRAIARDRRGEFLSKTFFGIIKTKTSDHGGPNRINDLLFGWDLFIPANALDQDFTVVMQGDPGKFSAASLDIVKNATDKARRESDGYRYPVPGGLVEINLHSAKGALLPPIFQKTAELSYAYPDNLPQDEIVDKPSNFIANSAGGPSSAPQLIDPLDEIRDVRVNTLQLYILDPQTQSWFRLPSNDINIRAGNVQSNVQALGIFAVMGSPSVDVSQVISFPVPFRPNGPNAGTGPGQTGSEAGGITFAQIPQDGKISIYDLKGGMVKELNMNGSVTLNWDTRTQSGRNAASGTYYWIAESNGNIKRGKLLIIR